MKVSEDIITKNNYILHVTKEIKEKQTILPLENFEIIENLADTREIKDFKAGQKIPKIIETNNYETQNEKENLMINEKNNEICNEYNEGEDHVHFGYVDAPFLEGKEEKEEVEAIMGNENISNLIDTIFEKLKNDNVFNDAENLKIKFCALEENDKNEVIEGIKIKIDNEEQENRFNNLLKLLI